MADSEMPSIDESCCRRLERSWLQNEPLEIADCLPPESDPRYRATLEELIQIDLEFSWKQWRRSPEHQPTDESHDVPPTVEGYLDQFPALRDREILRGLAEQEYYVRHRYGDRPDAAEYCQRFPEVISSPEDLQYPSSPSNCRDESTDGIAEDPGSMIGPYKLLQKLGEGGFGAVYLAEQSAPVRRRVALKIIKPGMDSREVIARFEAERQALAMMDHYNIAQVLDVGATDSGRPFFVMELVKGVPVTEYCDKNRLSIKQRLEIFLQVCHAVQHAHTKGIIHRDIKPSNVLVALYDGMPVPKVIDFGVAKAIEQRLTEHTLFTHHGQVVGTPLYMSPEQAEMSQLDIDTRSDIYSLGVLLYELLTGSTPLEHETARSVAFDEMLRIIREQDPPKPSFRLSSSKEALAEISAQRRIEPKRLPASIRGELDWIVMKALEKDRTRRYETASALAADLQRHLDHEPVEACPPSARYLLGKFVRKHRVPLAAAAVVAATLIAGTVISTWLAIEADHQRDLAKIAQQNAEEAESRTATALKETREAKDDTEQALAEAERAKQETEEALQKSEQSRKQAEAVSEFLVSAFRLPDPQYAGRYLLLTDVIDMAIYNLNQNHLFQEHPLTKATLLNALGETSLNLGDAKRAVGLLSEAETLRVRHLGEDHRETLISMNDLAMAYVKSGQIKQGIELHEYVLERRHILFGPTDRATLSSQLNLAFAYSANGDPEKSILLLEEVLRIQRQTLEPLHESILNTVNNLAIDLGEIGRWDESLEMLQQNYQFTLQKFGSDHPQTLASMGSLGTAFLRLGEFQKAIEFKRDALSRSQKTLGQTHPNTLVAMNNLGETYRRAGELKDAITLLEQTLTLRRERFDPNHPATLAEKIYCSRSIFINRFRQDTMSIRIRSGNGESTTQRNIPGPAGIRERRSENPICWKPALRTTTSTPTKAAKSSVVNSRRNIGCDCRRHLAIIAEHRSVSA